MNKWINEQNRTEQKKRKEKKRKEKKRKEKKRKEKKRTKYYLFNDLYCIEVIVFGKWPQFEQLYVNNLDKNSIYQCIKQNDVQSNLLK